LIAGIDLLEWIPSIPKYLLGDEYLSLVAIVNQEFNRQQVTIPMEKVTFKGRLNEQRAVTRIDIARNCLMSYLWEVILFTNSSGTDLPIYHGWFNFPKEPYQDLFLERNAMVFQKYGSYLETWKDLESRKINLELVRTVTREKELLFDDMNGRFYALEGERKKKARNIILPHSPTKIMDFLNDSTTFATFSPPGIYDASDPKHTKLGSFTDPVRLMGRHVANALQPDTDLMELEIEYRLLDGSAMRLVVGGIRKVDIPSLPEEQAHKGLQNSMGFGNHSFFEGYDHAVSHSSLESPFYSFLADEEGKWLDSHIIGIDGVLLHFDANNPYLLHVWVISFERHCFVGHLIADVGRFF
jgi:hypothetical protein